MASASLTIQLALALCILPVLAWAGPAPSGSYRADPLGRLVLTTEGEHVTGRLAAGGACGFPDAHPVLEGQFEGQVLVGTLTLCQTGEACAPQERYPILAIFHAADGSLVTQVRLREGCQSPALPRGSSRLVFQPEVAQAPVAAAEPGSASFVARKREKRNQEVSKQALLRGVTLMRRQDYVGAAEQFTSSIVYDESNWAAYHGLGAVRLRQGQVRVAIEMLEKAHALNRRSPDILYTLACAYARAGERTRAKELLGQAVRHGYQLRQEALEGEELQGLLSEAEQEALLRQVRGRAQVAAPRRDRDSDL
jgi:tetratricopeptide (TPR) repeat protein